MPVPSIHEHARQRRQHERRDLAEAPDHAQQEYGTGESVDEPARRYPRDPRANEGYGLAAEEQPIISVTKRSEHREPRRRRWRIGRWR